MPNHNSDPSEPLVDRYWNDETVWLGATDGWSGSRHYHPEEQLVAELDVDSGQIELDTSHLLAEVHPPIEGYDPGGDPFLTDL